MLQIYDLIKYSQRNKLRKILTQTKAIYAEEKSNNNITFQEKSPFFLQKVEVIENDLFFNIDTPGRIFKQIMTLA
jgi:hypothetical protein